MRKDVKFGLTIGAILVVTLVIYVIVLSRGPGVPQKIGITLPSQTDQPDQTAQSPDSSLPPHSDVASANTDDQIEGNSAPADSTPTTPQTDASAASTPPMPATRPAPSANANGSSDWDSALNNGLPPALSAPERTVTASIDNNSTDLAHAPIGRPTGTALIDPLPTTQPAPLYASNMPPTYSSPVSNPAPANNSAPAVDPAAPQSGAGIERSHRVAPGESLYSIAQTLYGNGKYYKQILAANPKVDPHRLRIGQLLVIPELSESAKPPAAAADAPATPAADDGKTYTVASGDSLEGISHKLYGSSAMIQKIYELNKTLIGDNENVLKIGWVLRLPAAPAASGDQQ